MNVLSLFSGIGALDLGLERAGMRTRGQVEQVPFRRSVLDNHWPEVPKHDDVRTAVEWWTRQARPAVRVVAGGFPCQPFSTAGLRRGTTDERWGWPWMFNVVRALRPRYVVVENVRGPPDAVLGELPTPRQPSTPARRRRRPRLQRTRLADQHVRPRRPAHRRRTLRPMPRPVLALRPRRTTTLLRLRTEALMPWVRYDDQASIHRKVAPLSDPAYRLWREATEWCSRNLTDGRILITDLAECSKRGRAKYATELVDRGLWHPSHAECPSVKCPPAGPDGWVIHDYWEYQPSKADVLADRERKAAAGRLGGIRSGRTRRSKAEANGKQDASPERSETEASATGLVEPPSRPVPTPLLPKREGGSGAALRADARGAPAPPPPDAHPPTPNRLTGSPDYDAIAQRATQGPRRDALAAAARAALNRTQETPDA